MDKVSGKPEKVPSKDEIKQQLINLIDKCKGKVWGEALHDKLQDDVTDYFSSLGIAARDLDIFCDDDGYISVVADDFFWLKDAN